MMRYIGLSVSVASLLFIHSAAQGQFRGSPHRGARSAPAMTANGPVYNPALTPEWRQAGGNYAVWEQIMMQKMAAQEQAAFQKQLAAYQKMLKAQGQKPPSGIDNSQKVPSITPSQRRVKKKTSLKASTTAKSKEVSRVDKSATTNQAETGTIPTVPAIKGPLNIPRSLDAVKPAKPSE